MSVSTDLPAITIERITSKSHIHSEVELAVEAARRENMRGLLKKETIAKVFTFGYYTDKDNNKDTSASFFDDGITKMVI